MSNHQPTEKTFLKDIAKHEMKVLLDNGIYRHIRFRKPESGDMWFEIVTWPGFLAYSGDMGCFVFSRIKDMFEFFRTRPEGSSKLFINTGYWGEKLEAVDRYGHESGHLVFSPESMREHVEQTVKYWVENYPVPYDADAEEETAVRNEFEAELREAIEEDIYRYLDDGEHEARASVNRFSFQQDAERFDREKPKYEFSDTWEWDCTEYTFRFVWCCYALAWAIQQYDKFKETLPEVNDEATIASSV
jgi:hypothetical protein